MEFPGTTVEAKLWEDDKRSVHVFHSAAFEVAERVDLESQMDCAERWLAAHVEQDAPAEPWIRRHYSLDTEKMQGLLLDWTPRTDVLERELRLCGYFVLSRRRRWPPPSPRPSPSLPPSECHNPRKPRFNRKICPFTQTAHSAREYPPYVAGPVSRESAGYKNGVPGGSRTPNLLIRSQMLYPIELQVRGTATVILPPPAWRKLFLLPSPTFF